MQIRLRRDIAANWSSVNPILGDGELGFETNTGRFKIGNGTSNWNTLNYAVAGSVDDHSDQNIDGVKTFTESPIIPTPATAMQAATMKFVIDNKYVHPITHSADILIDGITNKIYTSSEKTKLSEIAEGANNYIHPTNHSPSIITQDNLNRFVTDIEKANWNGKANTTVVTTSADGLMSSSDKTKLNSIASGATANDTDVNLKNRTNHTGTQSADTIVDGTTNKVLTNIMKSNYDSAVTDKHTHSNKTILDTLTNTGDGKSYLSNDGTYKLVSSSDDFSIPFIYKCTGTADDIAITNLVNNFLNTETSKTMKLIVSGIVGLSATPQHTLNGVSCFFGFSSTQTRDAKVDIDWSDAKGLTYNNTVDNVSIAMIANNGSGAKINHKGFVVNITNSGASSYVYAVYNNTTNNVFLSNCVCNTNGYGIIHNTTGVLSLINVSSIGSIPVYNMSSGTIKIDACYIETNASTNYGVYNETGTVYALNSYAFGNASGAVSFKNFTGKTFISNCQCVAQGTAVQNVSTGTVYVVNSDCSSTGSSAITNSTGHMYIDNCYATTTYASGTVIANGTGKLCVSNARVESTATNTKGVSDNNANGIVELSNVIISVVGYGVNFGISNANVNGCHITSSASYGMYVGNSVVYITGSYITVTATSSPKAIYNETGKIYLVNTKVVVSSATSGESQGVYNHSTGAIFITNCDISVTSTVDNVKAVYMRYDGTICISESNVYASSSYTTGIAYGVVLSSSDASSGILRISNCIITAVSSNNHAYGINIATGSSPRLFITNSDVSGTGFADGVGIYASGSSIITASGSKFVGKSTGTTVATCKCGGVYLAGTRLKLIATGCIMYGHYNTANTNGTGYGIYFKSSINPAIISLNSCIFPTYNVTGYTQSAYYVYSDASASTSKYFIMGCMFGCASFYINGVAVTDTGLAASAYVYVPQYSNSVGLIQLWG